LQRGAFSLIELMIVVVIMGVIYTLGVSSFSRVNEEAPKVSLTTLKEYMHTLEREKSVQFLCLNRCQRCDIYIDGVKDAALDGVFDELVDESVEVYTYDFSYGAQLKRKDIFFNEEGVDEEICFSYEINKEGVGEQVLVKFKEKVYDFSAYFTAVPSYATLSEATQIRENLVRKLR
jgi:prepilin-type N-terminal cleavage/methylation domain-containing protein